MLLVLGSIAACLLSVSEAPEGVAVPFNLLSTGHMTVQVKINGKGPYTLIFDTGAPMSIVNNRLAREAELLKGKPVVLFAPFGSRGEVKVKDFEVGGQKATDIKVAVMDHPTVELFSRNFGRIDGIVGFPFFARYKVTIDYQKKTLTFAPGTYNPPDVMQAMLKAMLAPEAQGDQAKVLSGGAILGFSAREETKGDSRILVVDKTVPGGAAEAGGLKSGDRLALFNKRWTDSRHDLLEAMGGIRPGEKNTVVVEREGKAVTLTLVGAPGI
jgi:hypothetical protein